LFHLPGLEILDEPRQSLVRFALGEEDVAMLPGIVEEAGNYS
jgi:hypothetical protein